MSTRKTIQINPNLFNIKPNKSDKKRTKKEKPEFKETSLKRELMKRIKKHANKVETPIPSAQENVGDINFNNDYSYSEISLNDEKDKPKIIRLYYPSNCLFIS